MECKWKDCDNETRDRSPYCSDTCKKRQSRFIASLSGTDTAPKAGQEQTGTGCEIVADAKCYGRQAVKCLEFKTRPEPLDHTDQPYPSNRSRYTRKDGTVYMFDAIGQSFECPDGEVYPTVAAVRQAAAERIGA